MKSIYFIALILLANLTISCSTYLVKTPDGKKIDKRLIGNWKGTETNQQELGVKKDWIVTRNEDGTYFIKFTLTDKENNVSETQYDGIWWVEKGNFYEMDLINKKTDVYEYLVENENQVKFRIKSIVMEMNNEAYIFVDTRIIAPEGMSFENAIKVNSVGEEYEYIKKKCEGCQVVMQALSEHDKKPFDILTVKNAKGEQINYYFDISSFFGK